MNNLLVSPASRKGFTLLELLVVIGIIGILMAVSISQFGGATESAKATTCMTNLRNLATACQNVAMANEWGHYPAAQSYKFTDFSGGKVVYWTHDGWIGWSLTKKDSGNKGVGSQYSFMVENAKDRLTAFTNGAIWKAVGGAVKCYQCPVHVEACYKARKREPAWSYLMNQYFGYDSNGGGGPLKRQLAQSIGGFRDVPNSRSVSGDRLLLFCEMQGARLEKRKGAPVDLTPVTEGSGTRGDSVLQCEEEDIGFNHKIGGRRWVAHCAFADGHVGRVVYPSGGLSVRQLTKALCGGHELNCSGTGRYEDLTPDSAKK